VILQIPAFIGIGTSSDEWQQSSAITFYSPPRVSLVTHISELNGELSGVPDQDTL
jgi:hypothetical protein